MRSGTTNQVFRLPDLGEGLTEAGLVQWLVAVGDAISTDQPVAEVETAKSIVELPSPFAGVVVALHGETGDTIGVGAPVLEVAPFGSHEDAETDAATDAATDPSADTSGRDTYRQEERAGSGNVLIGYGTTERTASGRRRPAIRTSDDTPQVTPRPVAVRSPIVRRLARDLGLDVRVIAATGTDGAVTRADVLRAAADHAVDGPPSHTPTVGPDTMLDGLAVRSRERLSPLRKAVSAKLSRSRAEIPEATVWVDIDATALWDLRTQMAPEGVTAPSLTALLGRFVLIALEDFPILASRLSETAEELIAFDGVNLGVATDTERGLLVPVIPRAHALTVEQLDSALRDLAAAARAGNMPAEHLRGSTFTLNNYGGLGVDGSAAIINHPDVAILGIGRIIERPWVVEGEIVVRRVAQLSLVFDHRVCDGGYAAGFLRRVAELIEHPLRIFGRL
ncbi:2-oxo acid dehydrogenase subunit E2 [Microbacterium sp. ISL-108]|nr:2-oxo acid dehydrogenase subunit E2 [Microbacterium sp. ISL-108]RKN69567.1 2-oxo acid dehydrogenase subunit E2 [Microbacterium sp. CGR2]